MFIFRADASSEIGFGHVMRCLALADAARSAGHETLLMTRATTPHVEAMAARRSIPVRAFGGAPGSPEDAACLGDLAVRGSRVVVDGYVFDEAYLASVRRPGSYVTYVDDLGGARFSCDAVLNHNLYAESCTYEGAPRTQFLLGPRYAIVRDSFLDARARRSRVAPEIATRLLVTTGGGDPTGETAKVLAALHLIDAPSLDVRVVVGPANPRGDEIRASAARDSRHRITVLSEVDDLAGEMRDCDLAIAAAGTTVTELACVGVPALVVTVADNQRAVAPEAARRGLARSLGWHADVTPDAIARALAALARDAGERARMTEAGLRSVDGKGKDRAIAALAALDEADGKDHTLPRGKEEVS